MAKRSWPNAERAPFESLDDFKRRVEMTREELRTLAELGALNCFAEHRRSAMWKVEETEYDDLLKCLG
jgi:DNA polymerase III, alpha subunit